MQDDLRKGGGSEGSAVSAMSGRRRLRSRKIDRWVIRSNLSGREVPVCTSLFRPTAQIGQTLHLRPRFRQHQDRRASGARHCLHAALGHRQDPVRQVRGFLAGGVFTFKGVPYGQTTAGENRWLRLKPPYPLEGRVPRLHLRRQLPAVPPPLDRHRADLHSGLGRRLAQRRHAQAQHLDAGAHRLPPRDGLLPRRRLQPSARPTNSLA
jgi:hypothetical protein